MYKSCSRCGRIHDINFKCNVNRVYNGGFEREKRNSYAWEKKSKDIRKRSLFCEVCKLSGVYKYDGLEVHHITKLRDDPNGLLDDSNLICLCSKHHKQADRGEIDAEFLRELAAERDRE